MEKMTPYDWATRFGDAQGVRLEVVAGIPVWEAFPVALHQMTIDNIRATIRPSVYGDAPCDCVHLADVYVKFPDGSLKRPDISVFCRRPDELKTAITLVPEAVIEIISEGYAEKDLQIGVPFYVAQGIKDILVLDPDTGKILHYRAGHPQPATHTSPQAFALACGCTVTI